MRKILFIALSAVSLVFKSCYERKVTRIDQTEVVDISGRWNDSDARLSAEEITSEALNSSWINQHQLEKQGKKPVIIVGMIQNKSHEHIEAETFTKDLEKAFIRTGKVRVVEGGKKREALRAERADQQQNAAVETIKKWGLEIGADYILQGSINSIVDSYKRKKVVYYQIDLQLTDIQTNEVIWIGDKKIKKFIKN